MVDQPKSPMDMQAALEDVTRGDVTRSAPPTASTAGAALWLKVTLAQGLLNTAAARFWSDPEMPRFFPSFLVELYSIVRCSVPLMERALERIRAIRQGDPLDLATMIGPQVSRQQIEKIASYVDIGRQEGAEVLIGGERAHLGGEFEDGYYFEPTVLKGHNDMRVFQEEIFGPVLAVTTFKDEAEAVEIANDTLYGLGAGVWTRNGNRAYRMGRAIKAGRVWTNCYHLYPAGAAFGGYKISGVGRENHAMMLEHYSQTKNVLVSYSTSPLGFF